MLDESYLKNTANLLLNLFLFLLSRPNSKNFLLIFSPPKQNLRMSTESQCQRYLITHALTPCKEQSFITLTKATERDIVCHSTLSGIFCQCQNRYITSSVLELSEV